MFGLSSLADTIMLQGRNVCNKTKKKTVSGLGYLTADKTSVPYMAITKHTGINVFSF